MNHDEKDFNFLFLMTIYSIALFLFTDYKELFFIEIVFIGINVVNSTLIRFLVQLVSLAGIILFIAINSSNPIVYTHLMIPITYTILFAFFLGFNICKYKKTSKFEFKPGHIFTPFEYYKRIYQEYHDISTEESYTIELR